MRVSEFSIPFACDLPLATNHNIILFYCFYMNLSLSFIVPGGWRGRGQAGRAARWFRLSSPSNNPGLLAGGRGWCGAGLLAAGAGQIPRLSLPSGFTEVTPATRPMQKICNNISAPIKNIKFLNHLANVLHNLRSRYNLVQRSITAHHELGTRVFILWNQRPSDLNKLFNSG